MLPFGEDCFRGGVKLLDDDDDDDLCGDVWCTDGGGVSVVILIVSLSVLLLPLIVIYKTIILW